MGKGNSREVDMLHGPLYGKMVAFMIPLFLSSALQLLFNAADVIVVGRYAGGNSLAAVGATGATVALVVNFFIGFTVGINYAVAKDVASGNKEDVSRDVHTAMLSSLLFGSVIGFLGIIGARGILELINTPEEIIDQAALYLSIYFGGLPGIALYNAGASIVRSIGDTKRPMYYLVAAGIVNVILNLYFVIVMGMNVEGVAIATTVSNYLSCFLMIKAMLNEEGSLKFIPSKLCIDKRSLSEIVNTGVPSAVQSSMYGITNILIQSAINSFGAVVIAGSAAAANVENFMYILSTITGNVMLTFMSQNIGGKKYSRIELVFKSAMIIGIVATFAAGGIIFMFRTPIMSLYSQTPEIIELGCYRLSIIALLTWMDTAMGAYSAALRGLGKAKESMIISVCAICGFRVLWLKTVFRIFRHYFVILLAWPASWILIIVIYYFYYKKVRAGYPREDAVID